MSKIWAILLVSLSALFWGANFNAGKYVVEYLPPIVAASLRFSLASIFILIILLWKESNILETVKRNLGAFLVLGIVGVAGFNGLFFLGLKYTTPINGALIMATNPLVTVIMAAILLKEPISQGQRIGMAFSLLGVVVVLTQGSLNLLLHLKIATGDWIILGANICWALYGVLSRRYIKNSTPIITTAMTMSIGTIVLILFAGPSLTSMELLNQSWQVNTLLVFMALFGSVLAYLFWNYGIAHLGAGQTAIFFNLVPVFTVAISLTLGQPISLLQLFGGILVILGVLISSKIIKIPNYARKLASIQR